MAGSIMFILILITSVLLFRCLVFITFIKFYQSIQCINPLKVSLSVIISALAATSKQQQGPAVAMLS
jgi:hypothetical protein